jgi:hypothetical protein
VSVVVPGVVWISLFVIEKEYEVMMDVRGMLSVGKNRMNLFCW